MALYRGLKDRLFSAPGQWDFKRCTTCHAIWLDPYPTGDDMRLAYVDYYTHQAPPQGESLLRRVYSRLVDAYIRDHLGYQTPESFPFRAAATVFGAIHPGGHAELARPAMYLRPAAKGELLLDLGCGNGDFLRYMKALGWQVLGIEPDPTAAAVARARGIDVREGELVDQNLPSSCVNVISLIHVIEHIPDPIATLVECCRILKPGGRIAIATPNTASFLHKRFGKDWMSIDAPRHLVLFDPLTMRTAFDIVGLQVEQLTTSTRGARGSWIVSRHLQGHARWDASAGPPSAWDHLAATPVQLRARREIMSGKEVGEEMFALARVRGTP